MTHRPPHRTVRVGGAGPCVWVAGRISSCWSICNTSVSLVKQGTEPGAAYAPAVSGAIQILDRFLMSDQPRGITELSRELGLSKATAFRIVHTLADAEVLECDPTHGKYRLGRKLLQLGSAVLARLDVADVAMPHLE